jgi:hypothetical protein
MESLVVVELKWLQGRIATVEECAPPGIEMLEAERQL